MSDATTKNVTRALIAAGFSPVDASVGRAGWSVQIIDDSRSIIGIDLQGRQFLKKTAAERQMAQVAAIASYRLALTEAGFRCWQHQDGLAVMSRTGYEREQAAWETTR